MTIRHLAREHVWAFGLAIVASVIVAFPQIYFRIDHATDGIYQGIELLPDSPWSARVREIQDGHNLGSIYYKDGKDNPYLFQPLGSMTVASMGKLFSLDINDTLLLSRFMLPFLTFVLMYAFAYLVSREKLVAAAFAAILTFAEGALSGSGLSLLAQGISPEDFLRMSRPVNPAMIYILFFGFLVPFWQFYRTRDWRWGAASVLLLAANFYNYFYTWTYLYAFGGILGLTLLFQKEWRRAIEVAGVYIGAVVLAIPYGYNLYRASLSPVYEEVGLRNGIINTHEPLFVGFVALGALALFLALYPREEKGGYWFGLALLAAPFVTMNQQLLTGKVLQAGHYHWFFHKPIALLFVLSIGYLLFVRWNLEAYARTLAVLAVCASVALGVFVQIDSYRHEYREGGTIAIERQKYGPAMEWLNANAAPEEVVLANDEASHMVVIYTPLNVFYHRAGMYSLASTKERLLDQQFMFYRLRGVTSADAKEVFSEERRDISATIYGMHYRELLGSYEAMPDAELEEFTAQYRQALIVPAATWISEMLKKYEVSYVLWDAQKDPAWNPEAYPFLVEAARFGNIALYRFEQ